jgi:hypothetical protein
MFSRLVLDHSAALFTLTAFLTAVSIYITVAWRALRMKRSQVERFGNLPFEVATPASAAGMPPAGQRRPCSTTSSSHEA